MTRDILIWAAIALLAIGFISLTRASSKARSEAEKKRLRGTAVGVDVAAAILFVVSAFI